MIHNKVLRLFTTTLKALRRGMVRGLCSFRAQNRKITAAPMLVVAPHPDDEVFGAGGLIALKAAAGIEVNVVFLTRGEASHRGCCNMDPDALGRARQAQAMAVAEILGLRPSNLHWLDLPDGKIPSDGQQGFDSAVSSVCQLLQNLPSREIYCPHPLDAWPDHEAAAQITLRALQRHTQPCDLHYYLIWSWYAPSLRRLPKLRRKYAWRVCIDRVLESKRSAIRQYVDEVPVGCNIPYVGALPAGFLAPFTKSHELFFQA